MDLLNLTSDHWDLMRTHVISCVPLEACGLLAGTGDRVTDVLPIANQAGSPTRFRMAPAAQLDAFMWMDSNHLDLLGIYHSHPTGPDRPSPTDVDEAAYEVVQLIWSPAGTNWQVRGFRILNSGISDVKLCMIK